MKRVLVTLVLALTTAAWGQGSSPAQQPPAAQPPAGQQPAGQPAAGQQPAATGQQANVPTSQKVIKDPAEYNAYITALNTHRSRRQRRGHGSFCRPISPKHRQD